MPIAPVLGRPGIGSAVTATNDFVLRDGHGDYWPGGGTIEGTKSRDPFNSDSVYLLRPGTLMGKLTSGGYYAPSILGVTAGAIIATATSVTVSAASAVEIVRRIGSTGTLRFVGPPTAAGTVATFTETYSAVNTTTGVITISGADAALVAGSLVCADDGSYLPVTLVSDGYGILIPTDDSDVSFPRLLVGGKLDVSKIQNFPADASLKTWVRTNLSSASGGKFTFSDQF